MNRDKSAEDVHDEQLRVLGSELGSVYHALHDEVTWLHAKWLEYRKLYAVSAKRFDLLNETASFFFGVVQDVLWENVLLHLARLTDPPKPAGKPNLIIKRLPTVIAEQALASEVHDLVEAAILRCSFARDWRNRHLAHPDLDLAIESRQAKPLPAVSRQEIEDALEALGTVLNRVEGHYFGPEVAFDCFLAADDADALVHHLAVAARFEERQWERFEQG